MSDAHPHANALAVGPKLGQEGFAKLADVLIVPVVNRVCHEQSFAEVCIAGVRYGLTVDADTSISVSLDVSNSGEREEDCLATVSWLYDRMRLEMVARGHHI